MLAISLIFAGCGGPGETGADTDPPSEDTGSAADAAACAAWADASAELAEGTWTGDPATCEAANQPVEGRANALRLLNYARGLAGAPPVSLEPSLEASAQECALLMHANDALSHGPPDTWSCWTPAGAEAAAAGLLAREPIAGAIRQFLVDFGNEVSLVHRRWLLNPGLERVAFGSTDGFSCLRLGSLALEGEGWTAWPPPGRVPIGVLESPGVSDVFVEGWSIQSDTIDLSGASVSVLQDGVERMSEVQALTSNQGSVSALRFVLDTPLEAGRYDVELSGIDVPIGYTVHVVRCP